MLKRTIQIFNSQNTTITINELINYNIQSHKNDNRKVLKSQLHLFQRHLQSRWLRTNWLLIAQQNRPPMRWWMVSKPLLKHSQTHANIFLTLKWNWVESLPCITLLFLRARVGIMCY